MGFHSNSYITIHEIIKKKIQAVPRKRTDMILRLCILLLDLTLILLTWTIWRAPTNASKWRMGFNSAFKGLSTFQALATYSKLHSLKV